MFKIMIIEDDKKLCSLLMDTLQKYGYAAIAPDDFSDIEGQFIKEAPHLILLDINLPYYDGFYFCRIFRKKSTIPIIITSARSGDLEQVMSIELGADDYIVKPFSLDVLMAKIKASLRRVYGEYSDISASSSKFFGLSLDDKSFKLEYECKSCELTKNEFKLLKKLLDNINAIVGREDLLSELWDDSSFVDDNTLTVNVTRVKSKLAELGITDVIKTRRGSGYIFDTSMIEGEKHE